MDGSNNETEAEVVLRNCFIHLAPKLCCTADDAPQSAHRFHTAPAWHLTCPQVAYCLGQRQDPAAVATLKQILKDEAEHPM